MRPVEMGLPRAQRRRLGAGKVWSGGGYCPPVWRTGGELVLAVMAAVMAGGAAAAPAGPQAPQSYAVVQALPDPNDPNRALSAALVQLGRNPRDSDALISAGNAALAMGDTDAASGFFTRADRLVPGTPRVQAGLASTMIRSGDPLGALPRFEAAAQGGALTANLMADRGLAYDLLGDNVMAQRYYREALAMGANDEAMRRLGLSLAISGDRRGMEATISPLLQKQDRASWRVRAFAFAILGREEEAVAIANATMPQELAIGIAPYLRYMRRLTPAQQAAAANLGRFPQASDIGRDEPAIAAYAAEHKLRRLAGADAGLVPSGEALGTKSRAGIALADADDSGRKRRKTRNDAGRDVPAPVALAAALPPVNIAPPEPTPSREVETPQEAELASEGEAEAPKLQAAAPRPAFAKPPVVAKPEVRVAQVAPAVVAVQAVPPKMGPTIAEGEGQAQVPPAASAVTKVAAGAAQLPSPGFDLARVHPADDRAPPPVAPPVVPAPRKRNFADVFGDLAKAKVDMQPAAGAVDIRKIAAPRPVAKAPPPPAHPSRIWVQLGVGRDIDRLAYDWRRMKREDPEIFRSKKPFSADWARTNRLLVGPFETEAAAKAFNERLHKADHDGSHVWISPAGQVVDELDGD